MSTQTPQKTLLVNASRVATIGGLHAFTAAALRSLASQYEGVAAIVGPGNDVPAGIERIQAPASITMQRDISLARSIYGFLYSILLSWRYRRERMLATTLLGFPLHRNQVITLHDVRPLLMPYTWVQGLYYRYALPLVLRGVKGVLTVSQSSKEDIMRFYPIAAGKVFVVPNVVRTMSFAEIRPRTPGEPEYLLMVNACYPHKNAMELLEQHALWAGRYRLKVLAGGGAHEAELQAQVQRLGLAGRVDFLPCASDEELAALYIHAAALVFPSLMEGFGIPPVEAMAYGTPVIVSDIPVFREVMRDGPIFVELNNPQSWKAAFAVFQSPAVQDHVARGKTIAAEFTQQRMDASLQAALDTIWGPMDAVRVAAVTEKQS